MDQFTVAHDLVLDHSQFLLDSGLDGEKIAESLIVVGLALWGAQSGRKADAEALLATFSKTRG